MLRSTAQTNETRRCACADDPRMKSDARRAQQVGWVLRKRKLGAQRPSSMATLRCEIDQHIAFHSNGLDPESELDYARAPGSPGTRPERDLEPRAPFSAMRLIVVLLAVLCFRWELNASQHLVHGSRVGDADLDAKRY